MALTPRSDLTPENIDELTTFIKNTFPSYLTNRGKINPMSLRMFLTYCGARYLEAQGLRHDGMAPPAPIVEPAVDQTPSDTSLEA